MLMDIVRALSYDVASSSRSPDDLANRTMFDASEEKLVGIDVDDKVLSQYCLRPGGDGHSADTIIGRFFMWRRIQDAKMRARAQAAEA